MLLLPLSKSSDAEKWLIKIEKRVLTMKFINIIK